MTDDEARKIETRIREEYARDGTDHALSVIRLTQVIEHLRAREAILLNDTRFRLIEAALAGSRAIAAAKERAHEAIKVADATLEELGLDMAQREASVEECSHRIITSDPCTATVPPKWKCRECGKMVTQEQVFLGTKESTEHCDHVTDTSGPPVETDPPGWECSKCGKVVRVSI